MGLRGEAGTFRQNQRIYESEDDNGVSRCQKIFRKQSGNIPHTLTFVKIRLLKQHMSC